MKRTKIVATIGPASSSKEKLTKLIGAGMNVMRVNFSHGDHAEHEEKVINIKEVSKKLGTSVAILQDLAGPKIRTGEFYKEKVTLKVGSTITVTTKKCISDEKKIYVDYKSLPKEIKKGGSILLDDGRREFKVLSIKGTEIKCKVIMGGEVKGRRGVNLPGAYLKISSLTAKDKKDIPFGIKHNVDFYALSFVRRASDITELRNILKKNKSKAQIIAKVETQEAIENIDEIIKEADGIMVARGDLAVEVSAENVPVYQKMIIKKCNKAGKITIVATQMLESMINSPVATRAEVSDIANSVFDGADAIMLSEETSLGEFPVEAVKVMTKVLKNSEKNFPHKEIIRKEMQRLVKVVEEEKDEMETTKTIAFSSIVMARETKAKAIVALTNSNDAVKSISRFRPKRPIVVMSTDEETTNQLVLSYGCIPTKINSYKYVGQTMDSVRKYILKNKIAKKGENVIVVSNMPPKQEGVNLVTVLNI